MKLVTSTKSIRTMTTVKNYLSPPTRNRFPIPFTHYSRGIIRTKRNVVTRTRFQIVDVDTLGKERITIHSIHRILVVSLEFLSSPGSRAFGCPSPGDLQNPTLHILHSVRLHLCISGYRCKIWYEVGETITQWRRRSIKLCSEDYGSNENLQ